MYLIIIIYFYYSIIFGIVATVFWNHELKLKFGEMENEISHHYTSFNIDCF